MGEWVKQTVVLPVGFENTFYCLKEVKKVMRRKSSGVGTDMIESKIAELDERVYGRLAGERTFDSLLAILQDYVTIKWQHGDFTRKR
jgi:hypothetical protein